MAATEAKPIVLVAAVALIPAVAGCEAGNNAPTLSFHYPTDAAGTTVGDLSIRNVFVLGAPLGSSLAPGDSASLFLAMVNGGAPDRLISVTAPGSATSVTLPGGSIPIVLGHPVFLSGPRPQLVLADLTRTITNGSTIRLVLTFQKAGPVTLLVPVMPRASHFVTYAPPAPSPAPSATTKPHHGTHPRPGTTASPGATTSSATSRSGSASVSPSASPTS